MKISLIIPAYNEAEKIGNSIACVKNYLSRMSCDYEIIVVDDGSSDETARAVRREGITPICLGKHMGKGFAVRSGVQNASGSIIIFTDADLPYDLSLISQSAELICSGTDVVIGSRSGGGYDKYKLFRRTCSGMFSAVVNMFLHLGIADTQCGFKAFDASVAQQIFTRMTLDGFGFDAELLFVAKKLGFMIEQIPVRMLCAPKESSVRPFHDGATMLLNIFTILNNDRNGVYASVRQLTKA